MIIINNLSYSYPEKKLYDNISFNLEEGQHCAFIGTNGSGKSTLIDLIINPDKYIFDGSLEINPAYKIAYVSQFYTSEKEKELTVFEYIGENFIYLQNKLNKITEEMESSLDLDSLLIDYQKTLDEIDAINGNDFENVIDRKLNLSNLAHTKDLMISKVSGGEFKLIQVIKEMLSLPDLMIMDEPDVFLDFDNLNSLKNLINSYKGTILVITHNRYLLNNCFNKIIHLENMKLQEFNGNYIDYNFSLLEKKVELQELAHDDNEEIKRNELLIKRFKKAAAEHPTSSRGQHVKSRSKIQERLLANRVKEPFIYVNEPDMVFPDNTEMILDEEDFLLKVSNLNIGFDNILIENINFQINPGDKLAIIGPNGSGKTTLLLEIYENKKASIEFNEKAKISYLSQLKGKTLNESNTVFEEFFQAGFKSYDEINLCISNYGLNENICKQKIESLSGGEKNILQLAKMSLLNSDLLLLDEPTSHLDTYSQIALEKAIKDYKGAILMVSHDFYSIVNSMDYILLIEDKIIRKMNIKRFKQMTYRKYFDKSYLELDEKKKNIEFEIEAALRENNFELAQVLLIELESLIELF